MARAFPLTERDNLVWCHPQEEINYVEYVLTNWQDGVNIKQMPAGPERDKLVQFCRNHKAGNKYKKKFHLETITAPGSEPRTVIRRIEDGKIGRIVVSRESVFDAIDEWHHGNGHTVNNVS